jgi:glycosyltransferase involved in cell wall biosynthesis
MNDRAGAHPHRRSRIAIDASSVLRERTGVGVYTYNLLLHLAPRLRDQALVAWVNGLLGERSVGEEFDRLPLTVKRTRIPGRLLLSLWRHVPHPTVECILGEVDLFHSPNFFCHPHRSDTKTVATIHDLYFLSHPETAHRYGGRYFRKALRRYSNRIDHFIAVSECTRRDLLEHLAVPPGKITVIHHGVDPIFLGQPKTGASGLAVSRSIDRPFFLSVGTIEPRKNHAFLIEALHAWRKQTGEDMLLVIAGRPGWGAERVERTVRELRAGQWVRMPGYVERDILHSLYCACRAVLLTPLYEGFGLPALEAMACGAPVLASDIPALREVLGGAGHFFPVNNREAFLACLDSLLDQREEREKRLQAGRLRAGGFTWDEAAERTCRVYERLLVDR